MAWTYSQAYINGNRQDPQLGDYVVVVLQDTSGEEPETRAKVWSYDPLIAPAPFLSMVRDQVRQWKQRLSRAAHIEDLTNQLDPD